MSEGAEQGQPKALSKRAILGVQLTVARRYLRDPGIIKSLRVMRPDEPRYVRPPREYDLPAYHSGMPHCKSNEKYLRPTHWCNPREPLVIAMANELGAYELSDHEFAAAAYWFAKTKLLIEYVPLNGVSETLQRGTGTCLHLISVWVALCRAAGIKARYKEFKTMSDDPMRSRSLEMIGLDETEPATGQFAHTMVPHGQGEACIDGKWMVGHVPMRPEVLAVGNLPITRFGEDEMDFSVPIPGTTEHFESIPWVRGIELRIPHWLMPASMERSSIMSVDMIQQGREIIEEAGGLEAYDRKVRRKRELLSGEGLMQKVTDAERSHVLTFED